MEGNGKGKPSAKIDRINGDRGTLEEGKKMLLNVVTKGEIRNSFCVEFFYGTTT